MCAAPRLVAAVGRCGSGLWCDMGDVNETRRGTYLIGLAGRLEADGQGGRHADVGGEVEHGLEVS